MNKYTSDAIDRRRLHLAVDKCHRIHVSRTRTENECEAIHINDWEEASNKNARDVLKGKTEIKTVERQEYLGSIISNDGKNDWNVSSKCSKGQGIVNDIISILDNIYFGDSHFEALVLLRDSLLHSVLLHDIEVLHNLSSRNIKRLESLDHQLLRRALATSPKASIIIIMLELAICPLRFLISKKRVLYYHHLLSSDDNLAKNVLLRQMSDPVRGDFITYVKDDLQILNLHSLSAEQISTYSKGQFKNLVSKRTKAAAFAYLIDQKQKLKKCNFIQYDDTFKMAKYLKSGSRISKTLSQQIFSIRSENLEVAENFPRKYQENIKCIHENCLGTDGQKHLFESCLFFQNSSMILEEVIPYEAVFSDNLKHQSFITMQIMDAYTKRCKYISLTKRRDPEEP